MEEPPTPDTGARCGPEGLTAKLSPSVMHDLLAAAQVSATPAHRHWQPPSVEDLQRMLPQYEITAFIARGGMGAVYKGMQRTLERTVAIKILPPDIATDDGEANYVQRFKQEARAMAKFKHPGIVTVYEAGEVVRAVGETRRAGDAETGGGGSLLYFVMEFIEGTDVAQLVAAQGQLPPQEAIRITTAVCDALSYAHSRGVVHRDIKPSNIMIDADGQVKVADFGLAKITSHEDSGLTRSSMAMGTPDFVAPETLIAGTLVDQRADIYAVGVMLYQMLTGHIPRGRFSPISAVVPKSDPKLDAIVDKAMQTDREKRYSSAVEMKTDVESVTKGSAKDGSAGSHARHPSPGGEAAKNEAHRSVRAPLLVMATLIGLGTGGWMMWKKAADGPADSPSLYPTLPVSASSVIPVPGLPDLPPLKIPPGEPGLVKEITLPSYPFLHRIALLPDSRRLLTFRAGKIDLIDLETETQLWSVEAGGDCESHAMSRDGSRFAHYRFGLQTKDKGLAKGQTAVITLRSTKDGSVIQGWTIPVASMTVTGGSVAMAPSGKRLVARVVADTGATSKTEFVALEEGHAEPVTRWSVPGHNGQVLSCVDEDHYLSTGNGPAMLLSVAQPGKAEVFAQTGADLNSAISPDGRLLVACDLNAGMAVWDTASRKRLRPLGNAPRQADMIAISSTGAVVMMGDSILRDKFKATPQAYTAPFGVWDSHTGAKLCSYQPPKPGQTFGGASSATAAANGTFFAIVVRYYPAPAGGAPNTVQVWRLPGTAKSAPPKTSAATVPHWPQMPADAEKKLAFTNTLGMKFVPVPGTKVLFCIHETRKADYAAYATAVPGVDDGWHRCIDPGPSGPAKSYRLQQGTEIKVPVSTADDHPAVRVNCHDASGFCEWLSQKEGRRYRLPTDREWSVAVGIADREQAGASPDKLIDTTSDVYPWGSDWPPRQAVGNFADASFKRAFPLERFVEDYDDGFATTAPAMSFKPNDLGLHDLAGNVWEWCNDWFDAARKERVTRGGSWVNETRGAMNCTYRRKLPPDERQIMHGFRIVAER